MEVTFNINQFDLTYKDVNKLSVLPVSAPFFVEGVMKYKVLISLSREGYEVNTVESRNIDIPVFITVPIPTTVLNEQEEEVTVVQNVQFNTLEIFARCGNKTATETDIMILNGIISQINTDVVIKSDTPIWEYVEPEVGETPENNEVIEPIEGGEENNEEETENEE